MVLDVGSAVGGVGTPLLLVSILGKLGRDAGKIEEDGFC
jgi:hypothetical protein